MAKLADYGVTADFSTLTNQSDRGGPWIQKWGLAVMCLAVLQLAVGGLNLAPLAPVSMRR